MNVKHIERPVDALPVSPGDRRLNDDSPKTITLDDGDPHFCESPCDTLPFQGYFFAQWPFDK